MQLEPGTTLVLGGTRSGKSRVAEGLAAAVADRLGLGVHYLATGPDPRDADPQWRARVAAHRARRPSDWATSELGRSAAGFPGPDALARVLREDPRVCLLDSLGSLVAELLAPPGSDDRVAAAPALGAARAVDALQGVLGALEDRAARGCATVVVSEEVGLAVHAPSELGRRFADELGLVNQVVAELADQAVLVVAGRILPLLAPPPFLAPGGSAIDGGDR